MLKRVCLLYRASSLYCWWAVDRQGMIQCFLLMSCIWIDTSSGYILLEGMAARFRYSDPLILKLTGTWNGGNSQTAKEPRLPEGEECISGVIARCSEKRFQSFCCAVVLE